MNSLRITNLGNPINQYDSATKYYTDRLNIIVQNVTLSGTNPSVLTTTGSGCFKIMVKNNIVNAPSGIFQALKNETGNVAQINSTRSPGIVSPGVVFSPLTQLNVIWPSNGNLSLLKTTDNFDGVYSIKLDQI